MDQVAKPPMKFGMTAEQYHLLESLVLTPLKQEGAKVFIFGSRATGKQHPYSDVDVLYSVTDILPNGFMSQLKEDIEESRFPFTVDLVAESDLADSYKESVFRDRIEV